MSGWVRALHDTLTQWRLDYPVIKYGESDCCQFAASYLERLTGRNVLEELTYKNHRQADKILSERGGILETVKGFLGEPSEGEPERGAICIIDQGEFYTVGVFNGSFTWSVIVDGGREHPDGGVVRLSSDPVAWWGVA